MLTVSVFRSGGIVTAMLARLMMAAPADAQVTADDFLPPVQGGPTNVKEPAKVKVEAKVVSAAAGRHGNAD